MFHIIGKMRGKQTLEGAWFGDKKEKNWENSPYLLCWTMISIETTRIKELCLWSKELQFRRHRLRSSQKKNSREENWTYKGNARLLKLFCNFKVASCLALVVKNPPASARDFRDAGSIPGSGRSPAGGHANHSSILAWENPMDRGASWAIVYRVAKNETWLKWLSAYILMWKKECFFHREAVFPQKRQAVRSYLG